MHTRDMTNGMAAVLFSLMTVAMVASGELIIITASAQPVRPMYDDACSCGK